MDTLAHLPQHTESVLINNLVQVEGTLLQGEEPLNALEFVRTIAVSRILIPLPAGREQMSDETHAL